MEETSEYELAVTSVTPADANQLAASLKQKIREAGEDVQVWRKEKVDQTTQDIGSILIAVISAPLAAEVAKGVFSWLSANRSANLTIKRKDGTEITVSNVNAETVRKIFLTTSE